MFGFPFYHQHDSMQCGIACIKIICRYYGKQMSTDLLESLCPSTSQGVSLGAINKTMKELGFKTICGRFDLKTLRTLPLPCILHWNQDHFVVLYKIKKIRGNWYYYISDPALGLVKYTEEEMSIHWISTISKGLDKGIALLLEVTPQFLNLQTKQEKENYSILFLLKYFIQYRYYFYQVFVGMAVGCVLQYFFPVLTQAVVDIGIKQKNIGFIYMVLAGQLMLALGSTIYSFVQRWIMLHVGMRMNLSLISEFFIKLLALPMSYFDVKSTGDILQRIGDHNRVRDFFTGTVLTLPFSIISFFVLGFMLFSYSKLIFLVFILLSTAYSLWLILFLRRRKIINYSYFEKNSDNQNKTLSLIQSIQEIKLQGCKRRRLWEWEDIQAELFDIQTKDLRLSQTETVGDFFINNLKSIIITCISASAVVKGEITFGMMLAIQTIIGQLENPISFLISLIYNIQDVNISLERINEVRDQKNEQDMQHDDIKDLDGSDICLENVSFRYDINSPIYALKNINLNIPQGKVTAIVGFSGCGKTTLLKLILGYYSSFEGEISIGGESIRNLDLDYWRSVCGVVMQDGWIFSESIAWNIASGDGDIDEKRMVEAARMADIQDDIERLPLRYQTIIGREGHGISIGQKQRILIARALYKNPKFLFLDEATNSLDASTESHIVGNLNKIYKGKTVLVIAHRLSTVKSADNIIVMDHGCIAEQGTHESLILSKGIYYQLIKNQIDI